MKDKDLHKKRDGVTENSVVYFVHDQASRAVKIGYAANERSRKSGLQTGNPNDLVSLGTLPGGRKEESCLHQFFAEHRLPGRKEWFRATEDVLRTIRAMLIRKGKPQTVQDELDRRHNCRHGLRGVRVALLGQGIEPFVVLCAQWNKERKLVLTVCPLSEADKEPGGLQPNGRPTIYTGTQLLEMKLDDPPGTQEGVPADQCVLMWDWPITCRCWMENESN